MTKGNYAECVDIFDEEPYTLVYRARCALRAVTLLAGDSDEPVPVAGYDLSCMLKMIQDHLDQALEKLNR